MAKPKVKELKPIRYMQTRLNEESIHHLKVLSAELRIPLQEISIEALNCYLRVKGKRFQVAGPDIDSV